MSLWVLDCAIHPCVPERITWWMLFLAPDRLMLGRLTPRALFTPWRFLR